MKPRVAIVLRLARRDECSFIGSTPRFSRYSLNALVWSVFFNEHHLSQLPHSVHSNAASTTEGVIPNLPFRRPSIVLFLPFIERVFVRSV